MRCPPQSTYRVVCAGADWLLDLPPYVSLAPGWTEIFVNDWRDALSACP